MVNLLTQCIVHGTTIMKNYKEIIHLFNGYFQILFNQDLIIMLNHYLVNKLKNLEQMKILSRDI